MSATQESGGGVGDTLARLFGWQVGMLLDQPGLDRWGWLRRYVRRGVRTLDAGAGSGWFAIYLGSLGNETLGISFDEVNNDAAARRARIVGADNVSFRTGDLRELERFWPEICTFDQIICFETIEHIVEDAKLVKDLADRLEPGGQLLMTTPYVGHTVMPGEILDPTGEHGGHVRRGSSHEDLSAMFRDAGLQVVRTEYVSGFVTQMLYRLQVWLYPRVGLRQSSALMQPLHLLQALDRPVTALLRYPHLCVAIAGIKPRD
jgi:2-polyprenyl-3-methyl-5-hydroxy-6-metoxy-1,4-benzoquinol methylase